MSEITSVDFSHLEEVFGVKVFIQVESMSPVELNLRIEEPVVLLGIEFIVNKLSIPQLVSNIIRYLNLIKVWIIFMSICIARCQSGSCGSPLLALSKCSSSCYSVLLVLELHMMLLHFISLLASGRLIEALIAFLIIVLEKRVSVSCLRVLREELASTHAAVDGFS